MMDQEKEFIDDCLKETLKFDISFAEARIFQKSVDILLMNSGKIETATKNVEDGFSIRVILDGAWGYAASSNLDIEEIPIVVKQAIKVGKANQQKLRKPVELTEEPTISDTFITPYKVDPFSVDSGEKLELLKTADSIIRETSDQIQVSIAGMGSYRIRLFFGNTEGTRINQDQTFVGCGVSANAVGTDTQIRSSSNYSMKGFEYARNEFNFEKEAENVSKEAILLIEKAKNCPKMKVPLILEPYQLGLTIHESTGHPTELDRVMGFEADFAGTSFLTIDKFGKDYRYGSELVNLVVDPSIPHGLGSVRYDDEGVETKKFHIIENGIFKNYMTDRELAHELNYDHSLGNARMASYNRLPIVRMGNLNLEPDPQGPADIDELIAETGNGIFAISWKSHSIDDKRINFQFSTELGWLIENGELSKPLKNVCYQAMTPDFWNACDMITKASKFSACSTPFCGKGVPMQGMWVSHGGGWARFQNVNVFAS
ncbi:MAG: TldD/PmbA family protein [Candidatus Heimdallarchaeota archaeon]